MFTKLKDSVNKYGGCDEIRCSELKNQLKRAIAACVECEVSLLKYM